MAYEGILFVTTDMDKWGAGKGSPLSAPEADENMFTLADKVKNLEDNPAEPIQIANFQVVGSQLKVFMSDGSEFGPFTLPVAQFEMRGDYLPDVDYFELDLISVPGRGLYMARLNHTSAAVFDPDATDGDGHALYLKVFGEDTYIYTFGFFYPGKPGNGMGTGDMMFAHLFNSDVYILADGTGSYARLRVDPADAMVMSCYKNGTEIGTITFVSGSTEGIILFDADTAFAPGDVFYVAFPDDGIDADAKDFTVTIQGLRGDMPS